MSYGIRGSGQTITREYDFTGFTRVAISAAFEVELTASPQYHVAVTVDDNLVDYLDVSNSDGTLRIRLRPNVTVRDVTLKAKVAMPELEALDLGGATRTHLAGFASSRPLKVSLSGASKLEGELASGPARISLSGASRVELDGRAETLKVDASGASHAELARFRSREVEVDAGGASHVTVFASERLDADASGASSIQYLGEPNHRTSKTSGASSIRAK